ncbi:hypothetical protein G6045_39255 [Streptomyces sp. YC504]|uniref:Uncharacterized protein n=1 Tax=Streptomyces mesophilus TaxID=1775132 RepID=A0A6G4XVL3_9ACTN|nr:hypothetical protein [Streptomyces mesophilus]NGO81649.1 hypothetical protein [Streptomyces mesophilus]
MIESWWTALVRAMRQGRLVLVPLLAVLITAHLASAAHSAPFAGPHGAHGPHLGIVAACPPGHHTAAGPQQAALVPGPAHDHDAGEHVDHSVDRPRDPGTQELSAPALPLLGLLTPAAGCAPPPPAAVDHAGPPGRGGERSSLCVWRQ